MLEEKKSIRVFLCYAHSDAKRVRALYIRLIKDGVDAWFDTEKLIPGSDWEFEISSAVRKADVVIVCLSKQFNQTGFRQKEVRLALDTAKEKPEGEIFIVPARLEECDSLESLKKWHWVDLFKNDGYERLVQTLQVRANKIGTELQIKPSSPSVKKTTTPEKSRWVQIGVGLLITLLVTIFSVYWFIQQKPSSVQLTKPVICTPQAPNVNIYREASVSVVLTPNVGMPNGASGVAAGLSAEQALALLQETPQQGLPPAVPVDTTSSLWALVNEAKNWSDVQTIKLDDSNEAQIVITFISPQLIQAIFNSEVSRNGYAVSSPQSALDVVAAREELIFFVTVITTANNNINTTPHKIQIPIQKMVIINAEGVKAPPLHNDQILTQPIDSAFEPVFGYMTYPIAMIYENQCSWILNPVYNKKIIIIVPEIFVDNISVGQYTWVIPYSSLFRVEISSNSQTNMPIDPNLIASSLTPPSPMESLLTPNGLPENIFWQIYAGFLWKQVMLGIY